MADRLNGPQGVASFNGTTDPADGNNRRKALLQLLMQKAQGGAGGIGSGGAVSATPFGGLRATPAHRDSQGQGFVRPAQVAAQFVGGLGVGSRGNSGGGPDGGAVSRFLPSDGGPVQRHVAAPGQGHPQSPQSPQAPAQGIPQGVDGINPTTGAIDPGSVYAQGNVAPPGMAPIESPDHTMQVAGNTPSSGSSSFIPLGNGAYFDPATGRVHYAGSNVQAQ